MGIAGDPARLCTAGGNGDVIEAGAAEVGIPPKIRSDGAVAEYAAALSLPGCSPAGKGARPGGPNSENNAGGDDTRWGGATEASGGEAEGTPESAETAGSEPDWPTFQMVELPQRLQ